MVIVNKCVSVNVSYLEIPEGVKVSKVVMVNVLNYELSDGNTICKAF